MSGDTETYTGFTFMIEWAMCFSGGFLAASLLALGLISLVHQRAVRLTHRRLEACMPVSTSEMRIAQDNLRAGFALSVHRLESSVEQLKFKLNTQLGQNGKNAEAISRLRAELARKTNDADELARKVAYLSGKIREAERQREENVIAFPAPQGIQGNFDARQPPAREEYARILG